MEGDDCCRGNIVDCLMSGQHPEMEGRVLSINGLMVHTEIGGKGKTLVLIHGLGGPLMWQKILPLLETRYHVIVVHLPGFGSSGKPHASYSIQFFVEILSAVLVKLGIGRCAFTGISLGGRIAAEYALRNPEHVDKLVLVSSTGLSGAAPGLRNPLLWYLFTLLAKGIFLRSKWLMCRSAERSYHDVKSRPLDLCDEYFKQIDQPGGRQAWLSAMKNTIVRDQDFAGRLRILSVPTLIVWGENDRTIAVEDAHEFHERVQGSLLFVIPGCAHSVPLEKPGELVQSIARFIN